MWNRIVGLGILWVVITSAYGQTAEQWEKKIRFDRLDPAVQDSLKEHKVNCLLRDRQGTTWFGTKQGLISYNGHEIIAVIDTIDSGVSLGSVDVQTLLESSNGDIWLGTRNYGAIRFRPGDNTYQQYEMTSPSYLKRHITSVLSLCEGEQNTIWAGTFGGGVYYYDSLQDTFTAFQDQRDTTHLLATSVVMDLHEDKHGILWGATFGSGLIRIDPHYQTFRQFSVAYGADALLTNDIFSLEEGEGGTLWIGTYGKGLLQYDRRTESFSVPFPELADNYIQSLHYDRGYLWVATQEQGIFCYDTRSLTLYAFPQKSSDPYSLMDNNVTQVTVDDYGTLWVITEQGVSLASAENISFSFLGDGSNSPIHQPITAVTTSASGDIWVGTADASLYQWNEKGKKLLQHDVSFTNQANIFTSNIITTIGQDDEQGIWVGTSDGTLARWNIHERQWKLYKLPLSSKNPIAEAIEAIYQDSDGTLWIGVLEQGLFYWNKEKDNIQPTSELSGVLGSSFTPKVFAEDEQYLWIGTLSRGVIQWHRSTGQVVHYSKQTGPDQSTLPSNHITGLALDSEGFLWIGTFDQGLCRLNTSTGDFTQVTEQQGLLSNRITSVFKGENTKLWIGSVQGISSYDDQNEQIQNYPNEEFFNGKELIQYCGASNGEIQLFGTLTGLIRVEAKARGTQYQDVPLFATHFTSNHQHIRLNPHTLQEKQIDLSYDDNAIEISYALQQHMFSKNHQYEYRLVGLEQQWKPVGHRTLASYTNLPPGTYQFYVRARASHNTFEMVKNPVTVVVHPAWYQTLLFKLILVAVILTLIGSIYYYRISLVQKRNHVLEMLVNGRTLELTTKNKYIEQQHHDIQLQNQKLEEAKSIIQQNNEDLQHLNEALEERVKQRTQELATTNEELLKSNEELDLFVYRAYHDIIGPIARIEGLCQVAAMEVKGQEVINQYLEKLQDNCLKTRTTLQKVLQIHHVRHHIMVLSTVNLYDLIQQVYSEVISLSDEAVQPAFSVQCDPNFSLETDAELLKLILQSFLKNAVQFSHSTSDSWIKVNVHHSEIQELRIAVEDNGAGIAPCVREKVFTMFFRGHETKSSTGLGLYIARLAAEKLQGTVAYTEQQGFTKFAVEFTNCHSIVPVNESVSNAEEA